MNDHLTIIGVENTSITVTATATERRDELLAKANAIGQIYNPETAAAAADTLKELKSFARTIDASRADVKGPVLALAKKIDETARVLTIEVEAKANEIGNSLATYQQEQNRIAEELRRKAYEETERLRREAAAKEREAAEAAAKEARIAAEATAAAKAAADKAHQERMQAEWVAANARTEKERRAAAEQVAVARAAQEKAEADQLKADAEAHETTQRLEAEAATREQGFVQAVVYVHAAAATAAPAKQAGIATSFDIKFEVTDIVALYEAQAAFVILSPNNAAIKAAIKGNPNLTIPGIRHWKTVKSIVR